MDFQDYGAAGATQAHAYRRLMKHQISLFRADNMTGPLPLGSLESLGLQYRHYGLEFTPNILQNVYVSSGNIYSSSFNVAMANEACYQHNQGDLNWWSPSGIIFFSLGPCSTIAPQLSWPLLRFIYSRSVDYSTLSIPP
jgi:hypothetical protein